MRSPWYSCSFITQSVDGSGESKSEPVTTSHCILVLEVNMTSKVDYRYHTGTTL